MNCLAHLSSPYMRHHRVDHVGRVVKVRKPRRAQPVEAIGTLPCRARKLRRPAAQLVPLLRVSVA